jgi:hypothetical protein
MDSRFCGNDEKEEEGQGFDKLSPNGFVVNRLGA